MKVLVHMSHPAHVHFFKNAIWNLKRDGHEVKITAKDKDIALDLDEPYWLERRDSYKGQGKGHGKVIPNWLHRHSHHELCIGTHN